MAWYPVEYSDSSRTGRRWGTSQLLLPRLLALHQASPGGWFSSLWKPLVAPSTTPPQSLICLSQLLCAAYSISDFSFKHRVILCLKSLGAVRAPLPVCRADGRCQQLPWGVMILQHVLGPSPRAPSWPPAWLPAIKCRVTHPRGFPSFLPPCLSLLMLPGTTSLIGALLNYFLHLCIHFSTYI